MHLQRRARQTGRQVHFPQMQSGLINNIQKESIYNQLQLEDSTDLIISRGELFLASNSIKSVGDFEINDIRSIVGNSYLQNKNYDNYLDLSTIRHPNIFMGFPIPQSASLIMPIKISSRRRQSQAPFPASPAQKV